MIVDRQNQYGWGKSVVKNLASNLQIEFSGVAGYYSDNLWRMRKFYYSLKIIQNLHHWCKKLE